MLLLFTARSVFLGWLCSPFGCACVSTVVYSLRQQHAILHSFRLGACQYKHTRARKCAVLRPIQRVYNESGRPVSVSLEWKHVLDSTFFEQNSVWRCHKRIFIFSIHVKLRNMSVRTLSQGESCVLQYITIISLTLVIELYFKIIIYMPVKNTLFVCLFVQTFLMLQKIDSCQYV